MSGATKILAAAGGAGGEGEYVEDVFSIDLWTGDGSSQAIENDIDLSNEGGMVWIKNRVNGDSIAFSHSLFDPTIGLNIRMKSDSSGAEQSVASTLTSFNTDGYDLGTGVSVNYSNAADFVGWTFRKANGFFFQDEVVKAVSTNKTVDLSSLGTVGMVAVKRTDSAGSWYVWHKDLSAGKLLYLEQTAGEATLGEITMSGATLTLEDGVITDGTYLVYAWAHDRQIFGSGGDESIIKCGSYSSNGSTTGPVVSLGWEPQYLLIKRIDAGSAYSWMLMDIMRGIGFAVNKYLKVDTSAVEANTGSAVGPLADGFQILTNTAALNNEGADGEYIYIAIRRPMKTPEAGTEVYAGDYRTGGFTAGFPVDMAFMKDMYVATDWELGTRLVGPKKLATNNTDAEANESDFVFDSMTGWHSDAPPYNYQSWMFKRGPGFMDVVCGNSDASGNVWNGNHSLGVDIEFAIVKNRESSATQWWVDHLAEGKLLKLNSDDSASVGAYFTTTTTTFEAFDGLLENDEAFIGFFFATLEGVSKVGSYTADATLTTIDCGFAAGARFILIKRTDDAGDWYVFDSARGISAGNDNYLLLNDDAIQVADTDYIDPDNSGFDITAAGSSTINIDTAEYIFLAIA